MIMTFLIFWICMRLNDSYTFWLTSWLLNALTSSRFGLKRNTRNAVCGRNRKIQLAYLRFEDAFRPFMDLEETKFLNGFSLLCEHWWHTEGNVFSELTLGVWVIVVLCSHAALTVGQWFSTFLVLCTPLAFLSYHAHPLTHTCWSFFKSRK